MSGDAGLDHMPKVDGALGLTAANAVTNGESSSHAVTSHSQKQDFPASPHTTFYASSARPALQRQAAMSILLKTAEGRERTLRLIQNVLRFYVFIKVRGKPRAPGKATKLLLVVFTLSIARKIRDLSEILVPFTYGLFRQRLTSLSGVPQFDTATSCTTATADKFQHSLHALDGNISSQRWLWTQKYRWVDIAGTNDTDATEDQPDTLLRFRLEGIETTLSLLDTVTDGLALFARLGVTVASPFRILGSIAARLIRWHSNPSLYVRTKLWRWGRRLESLADTFWLLAVLTALSNSEWERREVWTFGKRVRRLMRDEEVEQRRYDADKSDAASENAHLQDQELQQQFLEEEERLVRIRSQRRTLRDLRGRLSWLWWERLRLVSDAVFATYDVFDVSPGSEGIRATAGLISATVGFTQVWSESVRLAVHQ